MGDEMFSMLQGMAGGYQRGLEQQAYKIGANAVTETTIAANAVVEIEKQSLSQPEPAPTLWPIWGVAFVLWCWACYWVGTLIGRAA